MRVPASMFEGRRRCFMAERCGFSHGQASLFLVLRQEIVGLGDEACTHAHFLQLHFIFEESLAFAVVVSEKWKDLHRPISRAIFDPLR